jgi:hypothetical protein
LRDVSVGVVLDDRVPNQFLAPFPPALLLLGIGECHGCSLVT